MRFNMHYNLSNLELYENILESTEMWPSASNYAFRPTTEPIKSGSWKPIITITSSTTKNPGSNGLGSGEESRPHSEEKR